MPRKSHLRRLDELVYETKARAFVRPTETSDERALAVLVAEWADFATAVVMRTFLETLQECSESDLLEEIAVVWRGPDGEPGVGPEPS